MLNKINGEPTRVSDVLSPEELQTLGPDAVRLGQQYVSTLGDAEINKDQVLEMLATQRKFEQQMASVALQAQLLRLEEVQNAGGILGKGSTGEDVKNVQQQLNEWRVANGKTPIKADGIFGPKTEDAVKEFQTSTGLQTDGLAGPNTKARLSLENSKDFQHLNPRTQLRLRGYLNDYQKDPASRDNLLKLAKDPNFNMLPLETQDAALDTLSKNPGSIKHTDDVIRTTKDMTKLELTPEFQKLSPEIQSSIRHLMFEHSNNTGSRTSLSDLVQSGAFWSLPQADQQMVLDSTSN
jgi:putative peptidoglycan binding protein